ncbi:ERMES complex Ca(2+)-binding regulatory GTPase [Saccharomycopsis crataegensis]|uniref:Mitochondrial Rho GTPase n=1 Tax=Saccharomycopsis crataegensis TaxID=43959 RepID=A0AAV5QQT3_9ASCO|nr:ERMES complex Ca(2+)-binding regulatory GTPase [Saccharomycopsis crataegensis]
MSGQKTIRVVVCGDEGVGKSSLITSLVKETYVPNIQKVLPPIYIPNDYSSNQYTSNGMLVIDTSPDDLEILQNEIRNADVLWLVYSDHFTYERISLYWMVMLRSMGVNLPIVLCSNKSDLQEKNEETATGIINDEFVTLVNEFKEIESAIRCSAKNNYNVSQCFYLCQRAVIYPLSPLFDSHHNELKPSLVEALKRIFFLCDKDQDGHLNNQELLTLQKTCFGKYLDINELESIKTSFSTTDGLDDEGFVNLNKTYIENGRHETVWGILRAFHYTDSLSLDPEFLYPKLDVPLGSSVELSPVGYRFLVDLFILFDKDNDGGLNEIELLNLFKPTPGIPKVWEESNFPQTTVKNEQNYITLQGWLAQWSMSTLLDYKVTLEYLAYLGFETKSNKPKKTPSNNNNNNNNSVAITDPIDPTTFVSHNTIEALKVTKPRRTRKTNGKTYRTNVINRTVFNCFVVGSPGCGKTSLLDTFLQRPYNEVYIPTLQPRIAVNSVEVKGGKQHYLILEELGQLEPAVLANHSRLNQCDVLCLVYDSSNPESFQYLIDLHTNYPQINECPIVFVALKADLDKQQQRSIIQPEIYTKNLQLNSPLHVSCNWPSSVLEFFLQIAEAAQNPSKYTPNIRDELVSQDDLDNFKYFVVVASTLGVVSLITAWAWKSGSRN